MSASTQPVRRQLPRVTAESIRQAIHRLENPYDPLRVVRFYEPTLTDAQLAFRYASLQLGAA